MKFNLNNKLLSLLILIVFSLSACQKDDNSQSQLNLSVTADSTSFVIPTPVGPGTGALAFTTGSMTVNSFKFDAVVEKVPKETITKGPFLLDLFAPNPNIYIIPLPIGFYDNVQIKVSLIKSTGTTPAPLIVTGKYTSQLGASANVELDLNENTDIILKIKDQLVTDQFTGYTAYMKLYLTRLFVNIGSTDLDKATKTNGTILITSTINKTIYAKIKANLINSLGGDVSEVDVNDN